MHSFVVFRIDKKYVCSVIFEVFFRKRPFLLRPLFSTEAEYLCVSYCHHYEYFNMK